MKGEDKKWLLIDGRFICLNPDDQTMQSNLVQKGAKVLMGFQSTLFTVVKFTSSPFCYLASEAFHLMPVLALWLTVYGITQIYKEKNMFVFLVIIKCELINIFIVI